MSETNVKETMVRAFAEHQFLCAVNIDYRISHGLSVLKSPESLLRVTTLNQHPSNALNKLKGPMNRKHQNCKAYP